MDLQIEWHFTLEKHAHTRKIPPADIQQGRSRSISGLFETGLDLVLAHHAARAGSGMIKRLDLFRGVVHPWHHDHFGHMNVRHYAPFFDDATYHMWTLLGLPYSRMIPEHGVHTVSAQATTRFVKELVAGDLIAIDGVVTRIGTKSANFHLRMMHAWPAPHRDTSF